MAFKVGIIVGSKSDVPKLEKGIELLRELGVTFKVTICSAHRDPERLRETISAWEEEGAQVFIAAAGLAAHLPGVAASLTVKPVIGIPLDAALSGLDALLSVAQMPPGIPVAAVGVDNARNAALLAAGILALYDKELTGRLKEYRERARLAALEDDKRLSV